MKKLVVLFLFTSVTVSCLYEKGGVLPTTGIDGTGTVGNDPFADPNNPNAGNDLCGISLTGTQTSAAGEICFDTQILPLIVSNCATSGCHDSKSKRDGYDLTSYAKIVSKGISKGNASNSKLYRVLTASGGDRMPPAPKAALTTAQIKLFGDWINEGAKEVICQTNGSGTLSDTSQISFQTQLKPVLTTYCVGCHSTGSASGNVKLDTYDNVKAVADNGKLYGSIAQLVGYSPMPTGSKLSDCQIKAFKLWIDQGSLDN